MTIYLVHFDRPYEHARHYLGSTGTNGYQTSVRDRLDRHRAGGGARLLAVANVAGVTYRVVRVWVGPETGRDYEAQLKRGGSSGGYCAVCHPTCHKVNRRRYSGTSWRPGLQTILERPDGTLWSTLRSTSTCRLCGAWLEPEGPDAVRLGVCSECLYRYALVGDDVGRPPSGPAEASRGFGRPSERRATDSEPTRPEASANGTRPPTTIDEPDADGRRRSERSEKP